MCWLWLIQYSCILNAFQKRLGETYWTFWHVFVYRQVPKRLKFILKLLSYTFTQQEQDVEFLLIDGNDWIDFDIECLLLHYSLQRSMTVVVALGIYVYRVFDYFQRHTHHLRCYYTLFYQPLLLRIPKYREVFIPEIKWQRQASKFR